MTTTPELSRADEAVKEPGKAWKNRFEVMATFEVIGKPGRFARRGTFVHWQDVYPSRELAEQDYAARAQLPHFADTAEGMGILKYLGPIEVTP